ncbi:hypothetical protein, conserved [Babesia ovata]|uniref:C3H1-type domain-containing protein n=1 Tax=Babesia ovata TaxID=189622 RepID=A0A2H6KK99_9APIC|nr:uncharacterized protein BOVATA_049050 [Babesia ovata]GBE63412.1 hypothetical protein, conserved [Babesia ovata]
MPGGRLWRTLMPAVSLLLEKLLNASCGGEGCCNIKDFRVEHLKSLQEKFEKYDEIATKINSLKKQKDDKSKASGGTPSDGQSEIQKLDEQIRQNEENLLKQKKLLEEQITKLNDALSEPKDKILSEISTLQKSVAELEKQIEAERQKQIEDLQNKGYKEEEAKKYVSIPSHLSSQLETEQAKLKSHKASLESLQSLDKLITFHQSVDSDKNGKCKNLLTNLCSGLEKFLGYQETSKGYDGSGIVYSDLDRLCDGVMSFLRGVLESVKDDESVKKYDGYIQVDKLSTVLNTLTKNIGSGRVGLSQSVGEVMRWLGEYNKRVEEKTGAVTGGLSALIGKLSSVNSSGAGENDNEYYKNVKDQEEHKLQEQLEHWKSTLVSLKNVVDGIRNTQIKALDNTLQSQITHKIEPITSVIEHLQNSAGDEVRAACQAVDDRLTEQQKKVTDQITGYCEGLLELLYERFANVFEKINDLQGARSEQFARIKDLVDYLNDAVGHVVKNYDKTYNHRISEHFEAIRTLLQTVDPSKKNPGSQHSQLHDDVEQIKSNLIAVGNELQKYVGNLQVKIQSAEALRGEAAAQALKALEMVQDQPDEKHTQHPTEIKKAAKLLKSKTEWLKNTYDTARQAVGAATNDALRTLKTLDGLVREDLSALKQQINSAIRSYIVSIVNNVFEAAKKASTANMYIGTTIKTPGLEHLQNTGELVGELGKKVKAITDIGTRQALEGALHALRQFGKLDQTGAKFASHDTYIPLCKDIIGKVGAPFKEAHRRYGNVEDLMTHYKGEPGTGDSGSGQLKLQRQMEEIFKKIEDITDPQRYRRTGMMTGVTDLGNEIERLHKDITRAVDDFTGALEPLLSNPGAGDVDTNKGVLDKLQELKKKIGSADPIGTESIGGLHKNIEDLKTREFTDESTKSLTEMTSTIQQAIKTVTLKVETLQAVPGEVEKKKKDVEKLMAELKHNFQQIKREIDIIHSILTDADNVLERSIQSVSDVVFSAQDMMTRTIDKSKRELIKHVEDAFEEITVQVRLLFSHSRTADLTALRSLVDAQKTAIEGIITKDLANGVKGLLDKIRTTHQILGPIKDQKDLNLGTPIFKQFYEGLWSYIIGQLTNHPSKDNASKVNTALTELLQKMIKENHFSHEVSDLIKKVADVAEKFSPANFTDSSSPILQALKDGIDALAKQLGYAYASTYCCKKFDGALLDPEILDLTTPDDKRKLTDYGKKLSKVFMTCLPGWVTHMYNLQRNCSGEWSKLEINTPTEKNKMALWFHSRGYNVSDNDKIQNGHLRRDMKGGQINSDLLNKPLTNAAQMNIKIKGLKNTGINVLHILSLLYPILERYNRVCHYNIPPKPRAPSNIYLMLQWTAGLKYNHMYSEVKSQLGNVLKGLQKEHKLDTEALPVAVQTDMHNLITSPIDSAQLTKALDNVCIYSEKTLVAVLGHGHADGVYASDHLTNSSNLLYPGSGGACLDMLVDVLFRLYQQLWFLRKQCLGGKSHSGWSDCSYGRYVSGSSWLCNTEQCANQECNLRPNQGATQKGNQNGNLGADQSADQRCDQHPDCGMKSPLQSFLEDGLQGFLPHSFSSPGCKLTCTVSNHRGLPCKTPMGFADIGVVASHTKTGAYLERVLFDFCGPYSALTRLCNMLNCVLRRAPQTLDDIFGFLRGYLANWIDHGREHKCLAFSKAIKDAYFGQEYSDLTPTILFTTRVHQSGNKSNHSEGDLFTISECEDRAVDTCGVYLESLSSSTYSIFSSYNKKQYLSWFLYSAETFYSLLDKLYKQCCGTCTSPGAKCHGTRCDKDCDVKKAYEAQNSEDAEAASKSLDGKNHTENCTSIVKCQNTLPTLYMYGFSFGKPLGLCGTGDALEARRTCKDFCSALKKILEEESALIQLIKQIDEFIWKIRENFSYTLLALWSLSLLYLLHIAVVRLDVLRIRSHLKSPSSHRIAAQSLLAAARVRALANVKYFSP